MAQMSDITIGATLSVTTHRAGDHTTITHVFGSPKGKVLLRKWVDSESPPKPDDRGRICIKAYPEDLAEIRPHLWIVVRLNLYSQRDPVANGVRDSRSRSGRTSPKVRCARRIAPSGMQLLSIGERVFAAVISQSVWRRTMQPIPVHERRTFSEVARQWSVTVEREAAAREQPTHKEVA